MAESPYKVKPFSHGGIRAAKLEQLRSDVSQGLKSGPSQTWDADDVKRKARARKASKRAATY